jgi:hypothetical protein
MWYAALLLFPLAAPSAKVDTLVVCPRDLRPALTAWEDFRRQQGHGIVVVDAPTTATELQAAIRNKAAASPLKYLLIIGDVPDVRRDQLSYRSRRVPTNYVAAKINRRWGSSTTIATDMPYGDVDGDGLPDLAVGRIPADSPEELVAVVRKVIRYEEEAKRATGPRRIHMVAGVGGFGMVVDAMIEAAATRVVRETVPTGYEVHQTAANPASPHYPPPGRFTECVCQHFAGEGLAWIYMGHGQPTELDRVATPNGRMPILAVSDVPNLRCGPRSPLAVLVACHTGAIDAEDDCLAEELLIAEDGPVAAIAATRVTMPYGNTVLGYELLRACFRDRPNQLGEILRSAQRRTLNLPPDDSLRASLDQIASGFALQPGDLALERQEHVWMYHLLGDPLLRVHRAAGDSSETAQRTSSTVK